MRLFDSFEAQTSKMRLGGLRVALEQTRQGPFRPRLDSWEPGTGVSWESSCLWCLSHNSVKSHIINTLHMCAKSFLGSLSECRVSQRGHLFCTFCSWHVNQNCSQSLPTQWIPPPAPHPFCQATLTPLWKLLRLQVLNPKNTNLSTWEQAEYVFYSECVRHFIQFHGPDVNRCKWNWLHFHPYYNSPGQLFSHLFDCHMSQKM